MGQNFPGCKWVFRRSGKRVIDFRVSWKRATKAAGVPDLLFHDLRRTVVRNMRKSNVPQVIRMKISEHKTIAWNVATTSRMTLTCNSPKPLLNSGKT